MSRPAVYPSDVSDEERLFVAPYLCLMKEDAPQREHSLRAVFNAPRRDGARRGALAAHAHELTTLADRPPAGPTLAAGRGL